MTKQEIYSTLMLEVQNHIGVIAIMANYEAESAFKSTNLQNSYEKKLGMNDKQYTDAVDSGEYTHFAEDGCGYGLAQWTSSGRKAALFMYSVDAGTSIGDAYMQVLFTVYEMKSTYKSVWRKVCDANDLHDATRYVMLFYERPKDQSEANVNYRCGLAMALDKELSNTERKDGENYDLQLPLIMKGSSGDAVKLWQIIIRAKCDGIFGDETDKLTKIFQATKLLAVDGKVGRLTWAEGLKCLKPIE